MDNKRPRSRDKYTTSGGNGVHRRGNGLGGGAVGGGRGSSQKGGSKAIAGGGVSALIIVILGMLFGGNGSPVDLDFSSSNNSTASNYFAPSEEDANTSVAEGARAKYTSIAGNNADTITLMIYMCGTDLESKYGMASSDMQEMASSNFGSNINIIVYTGGCNGWKTSGISSANNQIYQVTNGGLKVLVDNDGAKRMTDPQTLSDFIQYCNTNFPANRNELILWDHGGGSVSGYGYDEKYASGGSMSLAGIDQALKAGGVKFDFIGFDACLMATAETALMLDDYADYMIASEETEPGIGWYYTRWLNELSQNTSMPTIEIGKKIADDFVSECAKKCQGQKTTLSVIDLAEFSCTVPSNLNAFSRSVSQKIHDQQYQEISDARYHTREFAQSSKIDQVDLVHLAQNIGTSEGQALSEAIRNAVKYNRTSSNMSNAYGVSIYFPYKRTSYVDSACNTYQAIGMDAEYSSCIKEFAKIETSGQVAAGGTGSPVSSLLDMGSSFLSADNIDMISSLLGTFLSDGRNITGLDKSNIDFMSDASVSDEEAAAYISMNYFDASNLVWEQDLDGNYTITLPESQWNMIQQIDLNMFYDDGTGYIDLGRDNLYRFNDTGTLIADTDKTWLSINGQPVAYYHTDTVDNGEEYTITGYVPAMLNGDRVKLILVFDNNNPRGYIAGADYDYASETDTVAKSLTELQPGDTLDFLCDYYYYSGEYQDSYYLGDSMTVTDSMIVSNTEVGDGEISITYCFTDIYHEEHWSPVIEN